MDYAKIILDLIANSNLYNDEERNKISSYFIDLLEDTDWLYCLEAAGVDNWSGCEQAREILQEMKEEDILKERKKKIKNGFKN